jgi:hypothetical protein
VNLKESKSRLINKKTLRKSIRILVYPSALSILIE